MCFPVSLPNSLNIAPAISTLNSGSPTPFWKPHPLPSLSSLSLGKKHINSLFVYWMISAFTYKSFTTEANLCLKIYTMMPPHMGKGLDIHVMSICRLGWTSHLNKHVGTAPSTPDLKESWKFTEIDTGNRKQPIFELDSNLSGLVTTFENPVVFSLAAALEPCLAVVREWRRTWVQQTHMQQSRDQVEMCCFWKPGISVCLLGTALEEESTCLSGRWSGVGEQHPAVKIREEKARYVC